jgi:hypothetical protein
MTFEIYAGGVSDGEIAVDTNRPMSKEGIVVLPIEEYRNGFSKRGRECRNHTDYITGYDVTTFMAGRLGVAQECAVLHPRYISLDLVEAEAQLGPRQSQPEVGDILL